MNYFQLNAIEMTHKGQIGKWYHGRFYKKPVQQTQEKNPTLKKEAKFLKNFWIEKEVSDGTLQISDSE